MSGTPSTATRGVNSTVAERRARALGKSDTSRKAPRSPKGGGQSEVVANMFGLLWIAVGGLIVFLCLGFVIGSVLMFGVLREISNARDFDGAVSRTDQYEERFSEIAAAGFKVDDDRPNINEGVTQYLWTVHPPNDGPLRVFSWQHYLESNEIHPTSNSAAMLDVDLGHITPDEARDFSKRENGSTIFEHNPDDEVARAIIERNVVPFARNSNTGWGPNLSAQSAPPLPA
nr:hypothetical protein [bacterium]